MSDLPDRFPVEIIDWDHAARLARRIGDQLRREGVEPDAIVGIARGGWFPARRLADRLGVENLVSLPVNHYTGTGDGGDVRVRDTLPADTIRNERVVLVDDSVDTGRTLDRAVGTLRGHDPAALDVVVLQVLDPPAAPVVDHAAETYPEWRFVINPWEFVENMIDMINGVLVKAEPGAVTLAELYELLEAYHDIRRSDVRVARTNGIESVLDELVARDVVTERGDGWELTDSGRNRYRRR